MSTSREASARPGPSLDRAQPVDRTGPRAEAIAGLRFLVVEDHDFQRWAIGSMLKDLGARFVFNAPDGRAALEILRSLEQPIDIIISDLDMPRMDGMEFIRRVAETGTPVSLILASALEHAVIASVETMATAYGINLLGAMDKPVTTGKLDALVARCDPAAARAARATVAGVAVSTDELIEGLDRDEFEPYFQPKVELATGRTRGVEALARWHRPGSGIVLPSVPPCSFIKAFEDNGQIDRLTWVMLAKAAAACRTWRRAGLDTTVSVNISLMSMGDVTFADRLTELVRGEGVEPRQVILEVTESAKLAQVGNSLENLSRLRVKGFGLSMDDYGTGYSSLHQLARIAFTELKIDMSLVRNAAENKSGRVILESTIDMARKLDLLTVAEGVETEADWATLKALGCDLAQGYFIAMPMPGGAFLDWARGRG